jgi:PIN domain nuclease of toxin-antitoxin system
VFSLPPFYSEPFDRLLIAQSQLESLPLITKDEGFQRYQVETVW